MSSAEEFSDFADFDDGDFHAFDDSDDGIDFFDDRTHLAESQELAAECNFGGQMISRERSCECLTPDMILTKQQEAIGTVRGILEATPISSVRILLQAFQWDANKMLARYIENPNKVLTEVGLPPDDQEAGTKNCGVDECPICFDDEDLVALHCGHAFCRTCWLQFLKLEIKERKPQIFCCGKTDKGKCQMVMDEFTVLELVGDDEDCRSVFRKALTNTFVDSNADCKWCPAPGCDNAVLMHERTGEQGDVAQCFCGMTFCFNCMNKDHRPSTCGMVRKWKKMHGGGDSLLDESLISILTRPCPRCKVPIQKNSGCNHMCCTKCSYHFCWHCMQKFGSGSSGGNDGYRTHKCNTLYEEDDVTKDKQAHMKKFRHYSERFDAHQKSAGLEEKMLDQAELVDSFLKKEGFMTEGFLPAVKQILLNREVLKWSYVFGYYRPDYVNKNIFENLQLDLERHTEKLSQETHALSHAILKPDDQPFQVSLRQPVVNQKRIAQKVLDALLDSSTEWTVLLTAHGDEVDDEEDSRNGGRGKGEGEDSEPRPKDSGKRSVADTAKVGTDGERPRNGYAFAGAGAGTEPAKKKKKRLRLGKMLGGKAKSKQST